MDGAPPSDGRRNESGVAGPEAGAAGGFKARAATTRRDPRPRVAGAATPKREKTGRKGRRRAAALRDGDVGPAQAAVVESLDLMGYNDD
jgi:hypothetical protein